MSDIHDTQYTQLKSIRGTIRGRTEVYWWNISGATMDHARDSGTVHGVSLGQAQINSIDSPGAFH